MNKRDILRDLGARVNGARSKIVLAREDAGDLGNLNDPIFREMYSRLAQIESVLRGMALVVRQKIDEEKAE